MPTTFVHKGRHVVTIMNAAAGRALAPDVKAFCALVFAMRGPKHADAVAEIIRHGLADDAADADALIADGERLHQ